MRYLQIYSGLANLHFCTIAMLASQSRQILQSADCSLYWYKLMLLHMTIWNSYNSWKIHCEFIDLHNYENYFLDYNKFDVSQIDFILV